MAAPVPPTPVERRAQAAPARGRLRRFWERVSEGQALNVLWSQFVTEARSSYRVYSRDLRGTPAEQAGRVARFRLSSRQLFWAIVEKLSPARRVVLLCGIGLLILSLLTPTRDNYPPLAFYGGVLVLVVLVMELADRVTMKRDLEIARDIQHWLVPTVAPPVPRLDVAFTTRPANTVSGDYYDVVPWQPGKFLLVVADVAGKSVPAALLMATFHASLRSLAGSTDSLAELVSGINRYAAGHSRGGERFTTAFIAEFDCANAGLTYINAGHNPPLLRRADGSVESLECGGVPLGILEEPPYAVGAVNLNAGDVLFIYTDGVVEAVNGSGQEYGDGRLKAYVLGARGNAGQMLQGLMQSLDAFVATTPRNDDITCLVARVSN